MDAIIKVNTPPKESSQETKFASLLPINKNVTNFGSWQSSADAFTFSNYIRMEIKALTLLFQMIQQTRK